jgi:uncharacterized OB-fold protein
MPALRPDRDYQAFLQEGRFMIQRSRASGRHVFFPRLAEPGSGADDLEWIEASGEGVVYSTTVVRSKPPTLDYNVALVELAEGPRMMSRVVGLEPHAVSIGLKVRARIIDLDGAPAVVFEPVRSIVG